MRSKSILLALVLAVLLAPNAWSDQIILKDGQAFSGKFIKGDAYVVEFRILNRVESFKTAEVAQIIFKEPTLEKATTGTAKGATPPPAGVVRGASEIAADASVASPSNPPLSKPTAGQPAAQQLPAPTGQASTLIAPVDTPIVIRTTEDIDTDRNRVGDVFEATLEDPLVIENRTVAEKGTLVRGRITTAKESGKLTGQSELALELTEMVLNGKSYTLNTADYSEVGSSRGRRTAATVGGTAALGAIIGAIAGGGKGAAVGAASGAAVGTGVQILTKGQTLKIPSETILEFKLQSPLSIDLR
jgi:hypothetical protein